MASIYLSLRSEPNKRGEHEIRITIVQNRKPKHVKTGYYVDKKDWDETLREVKRSHPLSREMNAALDKKLLEAKKTFAELDGSGVAATSAKVIKSMAVGKTYFAVAMHYEKKFRNAGKISTADLYDSKARMINELFPDLLAKDVDSDFAKELTEKLLAKGLKPNTIVGYKKNINSVLNKAKDDGLIPKNNFAETKKGTYKATKRIPLTVAEIEKMWDTAPASEWERIAKLTFLFSYYASGARSKDVLLMPKSALYMDGDKMRITWMPHKTIEKNDPEVMDMSVNKRMGDIMRLVANDTDTIFGLLELNLSPVYLDKQLAILQARIRDGLKLFTARCGITTPVNFHDARRIFSKHLKALKTDIYAIKDAMGHTKVSTTEGYVGKDQDGVDAAHSKLYSA